MISLNYHFMYYEYYLKEDLHMIIGSCTDPISLYLLEHNDPILPLAPNSPEREKFDPKLFRQIGDDIAKGDYSHIKIVFYDQDQEEYKRIWEQLKKDNLAYFYKHGCLPIRYLPESEEFEVVIPDAGRPKAKETKDVTKSIRINSDLARQLDNYCNTNNAKASDIIRSLLVEFLKNHKDDSWTPS